MPFKVNPIWGKLDLVSMGGEDLNTLNFFNGTFQETFNALVTSDGATVTMSLEQAGGGDLTMRFSDGYTVLDCTPAATIELTAGSDTSPQGNWIYILQSTKAITKSTSSWPNGSEHIKIGYFLVPSATFVQADGVYINQNWNDHLKSTDEMGHLAHMAERSRLDGAYYFSGVGPNGTDQAAASSYFDFVSGTEAYFKSTAGVIWQMHRHAYGAKDSRTDDILVVNWNGTAYNLINDMTDITADSIGGSLNNRFFNLTFWGVANKSGEFTSVMCNLPSGSYNTQASAEGDVDGFDVLTIPREFNIDSSTGFLICRMTMRNISGNMSHISTVDLRGQTPSTATGGASGVATEFADNQFKIFNVTDITKIFDFDASAITTGNTRTYTALDTDGVMALSDAALTTGSVPFIDSSGRLDENGSQLFWNSGSTHFYVGGNLESSANTVLYGGDPTYAIKTIAGIHIDVDNTSLVVGDDEDFLFNYDNTSAVFKHAANAGAQFAKFIGDDVAEGFAGDSSWISMHLDDTSGATREYARITWEILDETTNLGDGAIKFSAMLGNSITEMLNVGGTTTEDGIIVNDTGADLDFRIESDTNEQALYVSGETGFIGLGTTAPTYELDVVGDIGVGAAGGGQGRVYHNDDTNTYIQFTNDTLISVIGGAQFLQLKNTTQDIIELGLSSGRDIDTSIYWNSATPALFVEGSSGNIGIGTASPSALLEVATNPGTSSIIQIGGDVSSSAADDVLGVIQFASKDTSFSTTNPKVVAQIKALTTEGYLSDIASGAKLVFYTTPNAAGDSPTPSERMVIDEDGLVGIGTNEPGQLLHLSGAGKHMLLDNNMELRQKDSGGTERTILELTSADDLYFGGSFAGSLIFVGGGSYTEQMRIADNGNIGIGGTTPISKLEVEDTSSGAEVLQLRVKNSATATDTASGLGFVNSTGDGVSAKIVADRTGAGPDNELQFYTMASNTLAQRMVIDEDGLVGINDTDPDAMLDIVSRATGTANLRLEGIASQTADMVQVVNSDATELFVIEDDGRAIFQNDTDSTTGFQIFDADGGTTVFNVDTTNERIGIHTESPTGVLEILGYAGDDNLLNLGNSAANTTASGTIYGLRLVRTYGGAGTNDTTTTNYGMDLAPTVTKTFSGGTVNALNTDGIRVNLNQTGTHSGGFIVTEDLVGGRYFVQRATTQTGPVTIFSQDLTGFECTVNPLFALNDSGCTFTSNQYGARMTVQDQITLTAGGLTKNIYGMHVSATSNTAGTSTLYGVYINTSSGADTNWGFYENASAANYFNGDTMIGITSGVAKLTVKDASTGITNIGQLNGSSNFSGIAFTTTTAAQVGTANYSMLGDGTNTYFSAKTGGDIYHRINNSNVMRMNEVGLFVGGSSDPDVVFEANDSTTDYIAKIIQTNSAGDGLYVELPSDGGKIAFLVHTGGSDIFKITDDPTCLISAVTSIGGTHTATGTLDIRANSTGTIPLVIKEIASTSTNQIEVQDSAASVLTAVTKEGYLVLPGGLRIIGHTSAAGVATTTQLPANKDISIHDNTSTGLITLSYNDNGTIKNAALV